MLYKLLLLYLRLLLFTILLKMYLLYFNNEKVTLFLRMMINKETWKSFRFKLFNEKYFVVITCCHFAIKLDVFPLLSRHIYIFFPNAILVAIYDVSRILICLDTCFLVRKYYFRQWFFSRQLLFSHGSFFFLIRVCSSTANKLHLCVFVMLK